jgi:hypothetical protein
MIYFRRANFSLASDALRGAAIGGSIGAVTSQFLPKTLSGSSKFRDNYNKLGDFLKVATVGAGALIGAGLGTLANLISRVDKKNSVKTAYNRILDKVIKKLTISGFIENTDFTRDPKTATDLKTRVCIVISTHSQDLRLLINTVADQKLKRVTKNIVDSFSKRYPGKVDVKENSASDKYNEVTLTTLSNAVTDSVVIAHFASSFIEAGYPVYLIEVG